MPNQPRHTLALHVATKLATRLRGLDYRAQLAAVREWRATFDNLTAAVKKARRSHAERVRTARNEGRELRPDLPGVSGLIFDLVWDYIVEGAAAGAAREIVAEDVATLISVYRATETAVFASVRAARAQAGGDETRHRALRSAAVESAVYIAAAFGYAAMRPSSTAIDLVPFVGKEQPALEIAVLALTELGYTNAAIAHELDIDSARVRAWRRSARAC